LRVKCALSRKRQELKIGQNLQFWVISALWTFLNLETMFFRNQEI